MNQRLVELPIVYSGDYGEHSVQIGRAPISAEIAPPGDYMLFVLDAARVPSVARHHFPGTISPAPFPRHHFPCRSELGGDRFEICPLFANKLAPTGRTIVVAVGNDSYIWPEEPESANCSR